MTSKTGSILRNALIWLILCLPSFIFLQGLRISTNTRLSWPQLAVQGLFVASILGLSRLFQTPILIGYPTGRHLLSFAALLMGLISAFIYILLVHTWAAWVIVSFSCAILIQVDATLTHGRKPWQRYVIHILLALIAGGSMTVVAQIESRFSEEEFFAALQALGMAFLWIMLLSSDRLWSRLSRRPQATLLKSARLVGTALVVLIAAGLLFTLRAYQRSFYSTQAPSFPGISRQTPFLCGQVPPDISTYNGEDTYHRILGLVKANPNKRSLEYGFLALGSGDQSWADLFRKSLLDEARQELYTTPANSVKYGQYQAALRAYTYSRMRSKFPQLFSDPEKQELSQWFAKINRRAQTVEWVDWMYALAFSKLPEGPYENQENGAGLLALLESQGLSDLTLSEKNRAYLDRDPRGWLARFRNTDDVFVYQPIWLQNALFQYFYTGALDRTNLEHSFMWLLLQALPNGRTPDYNQLFGASFADVAFWGADILQDEQFLWMAGRAVETLESQGRYLHASPGVEQSLDITGHSPTWGSCLLYGDSGLPNQIGPLAPDKVVLRDGWAPDSAYLLLNLRFSGWHRYKATNTISLIYKNGPLLDEIDYGKSLRGLPIGRSKFRDKFIPRENLNGLLVERTGMSAVLHALSSIGSTWAQDPPHYAKVELFETGPQKDIVRTVISKWRGWKHTRTIYFHHQGPIIVSDTAEGPERCEAALVWHYPGSGQPLEPGSLQIREGKHPAEMQLLPVSTELNPQHLTSSFNEGTGMTTVQYQPANESRFSLVTVFLTDEWTGAASSIEQSVDGLLLNIVQGDEIVQVMLENLNQSSP